MIVESSTASDLVPIAPQDGPEHPPGTSKLSDPIKLFSEVPPLTFSSLRKNNQLEEVVQMPNLSTPRNFPASEDI
jgi:hypothetical protein